MKEVLSDKEKHRNSLLRIAGELGVAKQNLELCDNWEIEDYILMYVGQLNNYIKNQNHKIRKLGKEIDMLRQTSIFDFLKVHHDEIQNQETDDMVADDG